MRVRVELDVENKLIHKKEQASRPIESSNATASTAMSGCPFDGCSQGALVPDVDNKIGGQRREYSPIQLIDANLTIPLSP